MLFLSYFWASALVLICSGIIMDTESALLRFFHGSLDNSTTAPLEEPIRLLPFFNRSLVSVFYVFGYNETGVPPDAAIVLSAYLSKGNTNLVLLDWTIEGQSGYTGEVMSYIFRAVPNSYNVGRIFGRALMMFIQNGISEDNIHIVAYSLGAHLAASAGRYINENGIQLARITGLDPFGPWFDGPIINGLVPSSAKFVDVIHTNIGVYGIMKKIGTVDFWPNCGDAVQPGCPELDQLPIFSDRFCSHWRSFWFFAEAIRSPTSFPAVKANSCYDWMNRGSQGNSSQIIYLGDSIDMSARGNFYFSTRSQRPFARGQAGLVPNFNRN